MKLSDDFKNKHMKPTWIKNVDALRDVTSHMPVGAIEERIVVTWQLFATQIRWDEGKMRRQQEISQSLSSLVGCSWHRCVLHNQVPHIKRVMFQDSNRCGKVQYCGGEYFNLCNRPGSKIYL